MNPPGDILALLLTDLCLSDGFARAVKENQLERALVTVLEAMRRVVEAEGGWLERALGDALLAVFSSGSIEENARGAVRAAIAMREMIGELEPTLEQVTRLNIGMRAVVITCERGRLVQGRRETVRENAIKVASRMHEIARVGQILVAESVTRAAPGFRSRELRALRTKTGGREWRVLEILEPHVEGSGRSPTPTS
jgi:class 3 adenylate cyclase